MYDFKCFLLHSGVDEFPHLEADEMAEALAENVERTRWTGARSHILHPSSSDAIPMIRSAKNDGLDITVETRHHYLTLLAEEIPDGATAGKCCPPVREVSTREMLWRGW